MNSVYKRRQMLKAAIGLSAIVGLSAAARNFREDTPAVHRDLQFLVPNLPGGTTDLLARVIAQHFETQYQARVTVLNVEGQAGEFALRRLMDEPADGRTWLLAQESLITINPIFYTRPSGDILSPLKPVASIASSYFYMVVRADDPIGSFEDVLREARSAPSSLAYGSGGVGTLHHLTMESIASHHELDFLHVPYKSNTQAVQGLMAKDIRVLLAGTSALPLVSNGDLRMIAVTAPDRLPAFPDIPALSEFIPDFEATNWFGFFGRHGVPEPAADVMRERLRQAMDSEEVRDLLIKRGHVQAFFLEGDDFKGLIRREHEKYMEIASQLNSSKRY